MSKYQKNFRKRQYPNTQHNRKVVDASSTTRVNLREDQAGITEFVNPSNSFFGIVKSRFSDFQVNEIGLDGNVVELDDLSIPKSEQEIADESISSDKDNFNDIINSEMWTQIDSLANQSKSTESIKIDVSTLDKARRTEIHKFIKKIYAGKLVSSTIDENANDAGQESKKFVIIKKPLGKPNENRKEWKLTGEYIHFTINKENIGTLDVAGILAKRLSCNPSHITYCGTKDKRAVTTQRFCIKKRMPEQIVNVVRSLRNVHVGNFEFKTEQLKLGLLKGNRFRIALRHLKDKKEDIEEVLKHVRDHGFINYFGLQRFGNCASIPTYEIGIALLKSDYKKACELILKPREHDAPFMNAIREEWWTTRNSKVAASKLRNDRFIEKKLLDGLSKYGTNDYATALRRIPRNMLSLYPHAFQSLVFNRIASRRIKEYGLDLLVGDLVYRDKSEADEIVICEEATDLMDLPCEDSENCDNDNQTPNENDKEVTLKKNQQASESEFKLKVKALTEEDIASKTYSIFDIVLPLPGHDITYPSNAVGDWYMEILKEYDLDLGDFRKNVKVYNMTGAYRKLIIQPQSMAWEFRNYDRSDENIIETEWELLQNRKKDQQDKKSGDGQFEALIINCCLPSSCYATMFLRELLKIDTSATNQANLEKSALATHCDASEPIEGHRDVAKNVQDSVSEDNEKKTDVDTEAPHQKIIKVDHLRPSEFETFKEEGEILAPRFIARTLKRLNSST